MRRNHRNKPPLPVFPPEPFWHFLVASGRFPLGAILVAVAVLWAGFTWSDAVEDWDFEGAPTAEATVLEIHRRSRARGATQFYASYQFQTPDGILRAGEDHIPSSELAELELTKRARVQFLPGDPDRSRLFFPWMTAATAARANRAAVGGALVFLVLGGFLMRSGWAKSIVAWQTARAARGPLPT